MDYETVEAGVFGRSLSGLTINLLVADVRAEADFLVSVFGMVAHRLSADFAIMEVAGGPVFQLHSDGTYGAHPLLGLVPEAGPRGAGIELRLHEVDPDEAVELALGAAGAVAGAVVLHEARDRPPHGLREAVILSPSGYAWVPSRRLPA